MEKVYLSYKDKESWTRKSIMAALSMGRFSSDRSIQNYADKIWNIKPIKVPFES
jgi:starch phosphorylase